MTKILFPTDFSNVANNAFVHALGLAKLVHGELILLHTYELPIIDSQFGLQNYNLTESFLPAKSSATSFTV